MGVVLTDQPRQVVADHRRVVHPCTRSRRSRRAGREVHKFFEWSFKNGHKMAPSSTTSDAEPVVKEIRGGVEGVTGSCAGKALY
jgi:hypothetical protein